MVAHSVSCGRTDQSEESSRGAKERFFRCFTARIRMKPPPVHFEDHFGATPRLSASRDPDNLPV